VLVAVGPSFVEMNFQRRAPAAVDDHDGPVLWFVLTMEANVEADITALDAAESRGRNRATGTSCSRWPAASETCATTRTPTV
jgi:hypothetical protein